jgi:spore coat polysaccharide biosynthesis predicted glycosyltransferase SpsG
MPASPLLQIRADGGGRWGFGHLGRCLALAEAFGEQAVFRVEDPGAAAFVTARGGRLTRADDRSPLVLLDRVAPTTAEQVRELRAAGVKVVLLDDVGDGRAECELVIDPPSGASWPAMGGRRLAGFEHVLIRSELRAATRPPAPSGVLVVMGGSDPYGAIEPVGEALAAARIPVSVVLGPGYSGARPEGVDQVVGPGGFVAALASCAVLVVAYGQTLLEACYLGIPAVAVVLTADQVDNAQAFSDHGTALTVDASRGVRPRDVVEAVTRLGDDSVLARTLATRGTELVDGRGAERVAAAISSLV